MTNLKTVETLKRFINNLLGPYQISKKVGSYNFHLDVLHEKRLQNIQELIDILSPMVLAPSIKPLTQDQINILASLSGISITEAVYLYLYIQKALVLPGEVCEFGCSTGNTSRWIADSLKRHDKSFWIYDTFEGLPKPTQKDLMLDDVMNLGDLASYEGTMKGSIREIKEKISGVGFDLHKLFIIKGLVEESLSDATLPQSICFAYLDMDFYSPTITTLRKIEDLMVPDGIIFLDDYDYFSSGVKDAVSEFMEISPNKWEISFPQYGKVKYCILQKKT